MIKNKIIHVVDEVCRRLGKDFQPNMRQCIIHELTEWWVKDEPMEQPIELPPSMIYYSTRLSRHDLPNILNTHNLLGIGAEVGVFRGEFARHLLDNWHGQKLFLVDLWKHQLDGYIDSNCNVTDDKHEENYKETLNQIQHKPFKYEVFRTDSIGASANFKDESLDFVYIDANHSYEAVKADINAWWPKIKPNGIMGGHDYISLDHHLINEGYKVKPAVDEFILREQLEVCITINADCSWFVVKPPNKTRDYFKEHF